MYRSNIPPMKTVSPHYYGRIARAAALVLILAFAHLKSLAAATTDTWTGGGSPDGNWQNAANWGGTAPVAKDLLLFDGSTQLLATNDFAAGTIFGHLNFSSAAG